jgi:PAS domain S-box-containing protein
MSSAVERNGSFDVLLPPQPPSVAAARAEVRALLTGSGREDLLESAVLLVSEIVTNALLHAGTDIGVRGRIGDHGIRIDVTDGGPHLPSRRRYAPTAGTGRGLLMLEAMVDDWGVTRNRHGKTVWFELSADVDDRDLGLPTVPRTGGSRSRSTVSSVPVALQNMPLLLHAAWQEHAEALLREYLLTRLDEEGPDPIQMHADATDAIALLEEHVPRLRVDMVPEELMGGAVEPLVSASLIELPVPAGSVAHFDTLDRAIEAALDLSREGLVLTPPSQPEVQAFRRWLCRQVLRQAAGDRPEPWAVPPHTRRVPTTPTGWDPRLVTEAVHGVIAANETSQIIAVSPEAAAILGYEAEELVGERIVAIIPDRYRQAHVAGFTMYLLVGRKPLLDREVVVPAKRRDGSEVEIALVVRNHGLGEGHSVLLADIRRVEGT